MNRAVIGIGAAILGCMLHVAPSNAGAVSSSRGETYPLIHLQSSWMRTLAFGPNGPIPKIVVDQFGYPTLARKIAVVRSPQVGFDKTSHFAPGTVYALVDLVSGRILKQAPLMPWNDGNVHAGSGDKTWWFDFSDVTTPGRYAVVDIDRHVRSPEFAIGEDVYRNVMKHAVRMFFYQRAGFAKDVKFAGADWRDSASHLRQGQDAQSQPWPSTRSASNGTPTRDLRGGWYDAGDYNKYTNWAARNINVLLQAYEENPQAFRDDLNIPESENGVPDLLDEIRWGLEWLARMQNEDGSLLCIQGLASGSPPSASSGPSYYGPATTSASLSGAAAFAFASKIFAKRSEPDLKVFAARLAERAQAAWEWANAHPSVLYFNNDNARQPGSQGLAHGQQEMDDAGRLRTKVEAAVHLYAISNDASLKEFIEKNIDAIAPNSAPTMWNVDSHDIRLYYAGLTGATPSVRNRIVNSFLSFISQATIAFRTGLLKEDPYLSPIQAYTWGSNKGKAMQARLFQLAASLTNDDAVRSLALEAAGGYAHYIHGVNPLGLVYLTNMRLAGAEHSATTTFHAWFANGTRWSKVGPLTPGPAPGFLVGGPNPSYSLDACCNSASGKFYACGSIAAASICRRSYVPPSEQPPQKSYLQFNTPWPANSWAVTEPSTTYQSYYIRLLASFAR
ncbi:MAG: glycoside hydrolase family 9 protein [Hyphomicrobiaceae bacterium]|nr:glycoside hydrolase family 9 protein [Hyphomicrobiaceae bacterium]MCC0011222.1 glycoside hydrolase family 9 protein [Hyphomicrobiaceae bacterium]